jgi:predicted metal-dependent hydrolase
LPLALRDRLAERIIAALADAAAREELAALARNPQAWLDAGEAEWAGLLAEQAQRACAALADAPLAPPADLRAALAAAARLFDAALFFEVHEVLEPHWLLARDASRDALQAVIQIAVGWQHLANGNLAGARSLLTDGAERLHGRTLAGIDFDLFARAALEAAGTIPAAAPPAFPRATL